MANAGTTATPGEAQRWRPFWLWTTLVTALGVTAFDSILLQQKKFFFTGGFLTEIHTDGVSGALGFLAVSFLSDAVVAGILAAVALWLLGRLRLTAAARFSAALLATGGPFVIADFLLYKLLTYLGDAFDLSLMFDLTGRKPGEIAAVAAQQLVGPLAFIAAGVVLGAALVWLVQRFGPASPRVQVRVPARLFGLVALAFVVTGVGLAAGREWSEVLDDGLQRKPSGKLFGSVTAVATDVDFDGFGIGETRSDPNPFDSSIYPYAADIPGDGIDQDGIGGDLPAGTPPYTESTAVPSWSSRRNVVLIVLESFRADAVGRVVNGKPVTPALDALARDGISASMAFSHNGYTAQSRFHIFSGSLANLRGGKTLIDDFKANGYEVGYFSGQDDSFGGQEYRVDYKNADVMFDARQERQRRYSTFTTAGSLAVPYEVVEQHVGAFLDARDAAKPLLLYINFHDTHYPYHHDGMQPLVSDVVKRERQIEPSAQAAVQEMYWNAAANVDKAIGDTLAVVRQKLTSPPAVIVLSDHGESLFDEGFLGHGYALNDVQTRIPLIVSGLPMTIEQPFGQAELRDAIAAGLARDSGAPSAPSLTTRDDKDVFQYLGNLTKPRQIGFVSAHGRVVYDFRTGRARMEQGGWRPTTEFQGQDAARLQALIRLWERMRLAAKPERDTDQQ